MKPKRKLLMLNKQAKNRLLRDSSKNAKLAFFLAKCLPAIYCRMSS